MNSPHPEDIALFNERTISSEELILLMAIDGDWMDAITRWSPKTISNMLTHLRSLNLVVETLRISRQTGRNPGRRENPPGRREEIPGDGTKREEIPGDGKKSRETGRNPVSQDDEEDASRGRVSSISLSPPLFREGGSGDGGSGGKGLQGKGLHTEKPTQHPRWRKYATQLGDAIASVRKVNVTSKITGWAESFRKLHQVDGVPVLKIRKILKWYCRQIREGDLIKDNASFIPVAYSGATFREKFLRIEDAMKRMGSSSEPDYIPPEDQDPYRHTQDPEMEEQFKREEEEDQAFWESIQSDLDDEEE